MSTLSPQAQAVHLAAIDAYWDNNSMCPADPHVIAAAALRAAADQLTCSKSQIYQDLGIAASRRQLRAIAVELDPSDGVEVGE